MGLEESLCFGVSGFFFQICESFSLLMLFLLTLVGFLHPGYYNIDGKFLGSVHVIIIQRSL